MEKSTRKRNSKRNRKKDDAAFRSLGERFEQASSMASTLTEDKTGG